MRRMGRKGSGGLAYTSSKGARTRWDIVIFVGSCSSEIGITTINNKKFANLLQLKTLTMSHLTSAYYDNGNINQQISNLNSSSRQL